MARMTTNLIDLIQQRHNWRGLRRGNARKDEGDIDGAISDFDMEDRNDALSSRNRKLH